MAAYVKKPILYRGRTYKAGDPISAPPEVMKEWRENGVLSDDSESTESPEETLRGEAVRMEQLGETDTSGNPDPGNKTPVGRGSKK